MRGFESLRSIERAGAAADGAAVGSLAASDANVEHTLALLSKALAKKMHGGRAHRVYACALSAGVVTNVGSWALPALCLACVETGHLREAISLCDEARRALIALDTVTASALVKAVAAAKLVDDGKNLLPELAAKRLAADPPSMRACSAPPLREASTARGGCSAVRTARQVARAHQARRRRAGAAARARPRARRARRASETDAVVAAQRGGGAGGGGGGGRGGGADAHGGGGAAVTPLASVRGGGGGVRPAARQSRPRRSNLAPPLLRQRMDGDDFDAAAAACVAAGAAAGLVQGGTRRRRGAARAMAAAAPTGCWTPRRRARAGRAAGRAADGGVG